MNRMKIYMILLTITTLFICTGSGHCEVNAPKADTPVINIGEVSEEKLTELTNLCKEKNSEFIFFAPAGFEMPVKIKIEGDVISAIDGTKEPVVIKFQKPVYFFASSKDENAPVFSLDGSIWKSATELFGGKISFGAGKEKNSDGTIAVFNLNLQLNVRTKPKK